MTIGPASESEIANPFMDQLRTDPYPLYRQLRETQPVLWNPVPGSWMLTRYEDVIFVLLDPRFSADRTSLTQLRADPHQPPPRTLLVTDPPQHTRLRGLVQRAFTPRVVEEMRPRIQAIVDDLLDAAAARGAMDAVGDFAYPLPVAVIAELLGVPTTDRDAFRHWSAQLVGTLDPVPSAERGRHAAEAREGLDAFLRGIIAQRRAEPRDDLISALVQVHDQGDVLDETELISMCRLLLIAGHETTVNLIGNGLLALLRHPDQLQRLRAEPSLVPSAVEELLRFDSPVQLTARVAREDVQIGSSTVRNGQPVITFLGAANRDPEQFPDPDRLDLSRTPNRHVAFGQGVHFCLGAPLARLEGQIALGSLVRRFPAIRLAGEPIRRPNITLRGLQSLPVVL